MGFEKEAPSGELPMLTGRATKAEPVSFAAMSTIAAFVSWLTLVSVGRTQGPTLFTTTSALWGIYFGVAGILFGYQQEVTRRVSIDGDVEIARRSKIPLLPKVAVAATTTAFMLAFFVLQHSGEANSLAAMSLAAGSATYSVLSCLNGTLAAESRWKQLGAVVLIDSIIRMTALLVVSRLSASPILVAAAIGSGSLAWLPFLWRASARRSLITGSGLSGSGVRVVLAMAIAGCSAILIAGFPALVVASGSGGIDASTGSSLALITILRAPLVVVAGPLAVIVMASAAERSGRHPSIRPRWYVSLALLLILAAIAAYSWGPTLLGMVFTASFVASGALAVGAFVSSFLFLGLFVSGTILVARGRHFASLSGWAVALASTLVCLGAPAASDARLIAALTVPLALGFGTHLYAVKGLRSGYAWADLRAMSPWHDKREP